MAGRRERDGSKDTEEEKQGQEDENAFVICSGKISNVLQRKTDEDNTRIGNRTKREEDESANER